MAWTPEPGGVAPEQQVVCIALPHSPRTNLGATNIFCDLIAAVGDAHLRWVDAAEPRGQPVRAYGDELSIG